MEGGEEAAEVMTSEQESFDKRRADKAGLS
jgi:hypothetical protein